MSNATPGPWMIDDCNVIRASSPNDNECVIVAEYAHTPLGLDGARPVRLEEAKANARLIAAAPELLEALKIAVEHIEHMAAFIAEQKAGYSFEGLGEDSPTIRAAIAKAIGSRD